MSIDPDLIARVARSFAAAFGGAPDFLIQAPGRVNLIGEHTDYNDGFVLPCAIDRCTVVAGRRQNNGEVRAVAADYGSTRDRFRLDAAIAPRADAPWANYVRGVAEMLRRDGVAMNGAEIAMGGNIPQGAGLSSSASLEVAVGSALTHCAGMTLPPAVLARIAQRAENDFVGCACGIMDQLISARAEPGAALLIDCRSLECRAVTVPEGLVVMIIHSGVERGLVDSAYNERRRQCEAAARHYGVAALRDLDLTGLEADRQALDDVVYRRARHVVTENARTLAAADALAEGDLALLGTLMAESHRSMRDDFEITVPAIDALAALAAREIGNEGGARMTGGGFGGCIVALMPRERAASVRATIEAGYQTPTGGKPHILECRPSAGVSLL